MQPETIGRLERLRQRAEELGRLASEAHTTAPESTEGLDASGCVRIVLGRDRLPVRIHIRDRWQDRLDAGSLADAVMDANTDAVRNAYRTWSDHLDDSGWRRRRREADETAGPRTTPLPQSRCLLEDPELGERVLRLLQDTRRNASQPPAQVEGTDTSGSVRIRLASGGLAGCVIAEGWARHRRGDEITVTLSHALQQASRRLTSTQPALHQADSLIGEALAALASLVETTPAGGDKR